MLEVAEPVRRATSARTSSTTSRFAVAEGEVGGDHRLQRRRQDDAVPRRLRAAAAVRAATVRFDGAPITGRRAHRIARRGLAYVPAERHLFPQMTVDREPRPRRLPAAARRGSGGRSCSSCSRGWPSGDASAPATMSGGEQQMLAVGRALMAQAAAAAARRADHRSRPEARRRGVRRARRPARHGLTIVVAEQQVPLALELADRGYVLENGRIQLDGHRRRAEQQPRRPARLPGNRVSAVARPARVSAGGSAPDRGRSRCGNRAVARGSA